jgi:hypothetical protein
VYMWLQVVVLDGVAYHQGTEGVKVLEGSERTPFMTVTVFSKARSKQVGRQCAAQDVLRGLVIWLCLTHHCMSLLLDVTLSVLPGRPGSTCCIDKQGAQQAGGPAQCVA